MGRALRVDIGGEFYHVLNRANARVKIFRSKNDYGLFEEVLKEAIERTSMRVLAYSIMPNHWHFVLWPHLDGDLSKFVGWLSLTHTQRHHARRGKRGYGHLYQGRYKSFLIEDDDHLLTVCRYVERNPVTGNLVKKAQEWPWGSSSTKSRFCSTWPMKKPKNWLTMVNRPISEKENWVIEEAIKRGRPYGSSSWIERTVKKYGLESTFRRRGRPKKGS